MAYHSIVVAAVEADPKAGVVDAEPAVEKRTADAQGEKRGCIGCGLQGCSLKKTVTTVIDGRIVAGNSLAVGELGCSCLKAGCSLAVATCTAGLGL